MAGADRMKRTGGSSQRLHKCTAVGTAHGKDRPLRFHRKTAQYAQVQYALGLTVESQVRFVGRNESRGPFIQNQTDADR
jgi:hypothetical protein